MRRQTTAGRGARTRRRAGRVIRVRLLTGRVTLALCLIGGVAGCVNVPTGGRVGSGQAAERAGPVDDPYVRLIPVPPGKDWLPNEIVQGFLTASASFDDEHAVAKMYLAPRVSWEPDPKPSVTVYEGALNVGSPTAGGQGGGVKIQVTGRRLGTIGRDGQYQAIAGKVDESFELGKDAHGQWRITRLPDGLQAGLLLGQRDVDRAFRTLNLYFFVPDGTVLVPNPIFLPLINRRELPSQLVRAVLSGPTSWLREAVRTEFPPGTQLLDDRVDVTEGVATVNLSKQAAGGSLSGMSAQLMWTLRQLPEVTRMRLEIDGEPVNPPGVGATQMPHDWRINDADLTRRPAIYLSAADGQLQTLNGDRVDPVGQPGAFRLFEPAVSLDQEYVAGLTEARDTVLAGDIGGSPPGRVLRAPAPGGRFISPSWDRLGTLWMVENRRGGSRLWVREQGKAPTEIHKWELRGRSVKALRIARDGVRVAAIVETGGHEQIQMGRIVRGPGGVAGVSNFLPISSELLNAKDLAWRNADELAVLGSTQRQPQMVPYQVPVSGGQIRPVGTGGGDMISITALPHSPLLVGMRTEDRGKSVARICSQRDENDPISEWNCFASGHDPSYPG